MLKQCFVCTLLSFVLASGLGCHSGPTSSHLEVSPPSPSGKSTTTTVAQDPPSLRLDGIYPGLSWDSVVELQNQRGYRPTKSPGPKYDFVPNEMDIHHLSGPSVVVGEGNRIIEVSSDHPTIQHFSRDEVLLTWGTSGEQIRSALGEPAQTTSLGNGRQSWSFPELGLTITVSGPDEGLLSAKLERPQFDQTLDATRQDG